MHDGDLTRSTFDPSRHYSGVRLQQGRVQLDADWNEQLDIDWHRAVAAGTDTIGPAGAPRGDSGFALTLAPTGDDLLLAPGRCWVAGVMCENPAEVIAAEVAGSAATLATTVLDGRALGVHDWLLLVDATGTSQTVRVAALDTEARVAQLDPEPVPLTAPVTAVRLSSYAVQPDLPTPALTGQTGADQPRQLALDDGQYLAYLDVWQRGLTAVDDPHIRERALGGPDTATRTRTVWQVRLLPLDGAPAGLTRGDDLSRWTGPAFGTPTGRLAARGQTPADQVDVCTPTPAGGFIGLENQLYRVQVRELAADGSPVLVWSRDNASVSTTWSASNVGAGELTVASNGPDSVRGFGADQWVELTDDERLLDARPGTLVRLLKAEGSTLFVDPASAIGGTFDHDDFGSGAIARRWDGDGTTNPAAGDWVELELGVTIRLTAGTYRPGDYWLVPARTSTADVEWPLDGLGRPIDVPPDGVEHGRAPLAILRALAGTVTVVPLLREFPSLTTLTAADVGYDDSVAQLPDTATVQQALDRLAALHDLRRHQQRLHGWGIVDGLQVRCGPNPGSERRFVSVRPGSAITPLGDDLDLSDGTSVDLLDAVATLGQDGGSAVLDANGDGDVCLSMSMTDLDDQGLPAMEVTRYQAPDRQDTLDGTLLMDFYRDNIKSLRDWLDAEFAPPADETLPVGPQRQLVAALGNLLAQPVNPRSGRNVFISRREDDLLQRFYTGLRNRLQSETFCAMFEGARVPPAYPDIPAGLDTVFGTGGHSRVRMRPGGGEAWTVGSGVNPAKPTALVNRYDLVRGVLVSRIDAVAGVEVTSDNAVDTGTAAVTDVAFSPDGSTVYVAIPTRSEDNTIFRVGTVTTTGVDWRPSVTICGLKLVTLATTAADPNFVYAIAHHKMTVTQNGTATTTWHGTGMLRIDPSNVDPRPQPLPIGDFFPAGQLVITPEGRALATAMNGDVEVGDYATVVQVALPAGQETAVRLQLPSTGSDELAAISYSVGVFRLRITVVAVVVGDSTKSLVVYNAADGSVIGQPITVHDGTGAVSVTGTGLRFAVAVADEYLMRVVDATSGQLLSDHVIPLQVGPVSVATAARSSTLVALNYVSNTLSLVPVASLEPAQSVDLDVLSAYRAGMIEAFSDLLGGFLQYLKDGFFDHFLVNAPTPTGKETLYLAAVSIRGNQVYRVCNFSKRHYVKSFPLVGYWLSAVPVLSLLGQELVKAACAVLVPRFNDYHVDQGSDADSRVSVEQLMSLLQFAQSRDIGAKFDELRRRRSMVTGAVRSTVQLRPRPAPAGGLVVGASTVGQPADAIARSLADKGITVAREPVSSDGGVRSLLGQLPLMFGDAAPGDRVTLYESDGRVQYFCVERAPAAAPAPRPSSGPPPGTQELLDRLDALEQEVAQLRSDRATVSRPSPDKE